MGRKARWFFDVAYSRCRSMRTSMLALEFLVGWGRASDAVERPVTVEEYAEFVGASRSQSFRRQAAFRQCFPADNMEKTWAIVKPFLDEAGLQASSITTQAMRVGSMRWNPETWPPKKGSRS